MNYQAFYDRHGAKGILMRWMLEKEVSDFLGMQVTGGVILFDALMGDGMRDQVSPELLSGFRELMGDKADTFDEVRNVLVEKLALGDASVAGLVNKIKGQIGENMFAEAAKEAGFSAHLADLKNQEAWDCCVTDKNGVAQYVQIKTYDNPDAVVHHMQVVAEKVAAGKITDGDKAVDAISFAVPSDIHDAVVQKAQAVGLDTPVLSFDLSAHDAAQIVKDGFDNVAGLGHVFEQLAGSTLTAATIHALVQGFILKKGAVAVAQETSVSAVGIGASMGMEATALKWFGLTAKSFPAVAILLVTGLTARGLARRIMARHDYAGFLRVENALLRQRLNMPLLSER